MCICLICLFTRADTYSYLCIPCITYASTVLALGWKSFPLSNSRTVCGSENVTRASVNTVFSRKMGENLGKVSSIKYQVISLWCFTDLLFFRVIRRVLKVLLSCYIYLFVQRLQELYTSNISTFKNHHGCCCRFYLGKLIINATEKQENGGEPSFAPELHYSNTLNWLRKTRL